MLFGVHYDSVSKSTYYCSTMRQRQIMKSPITGTKVHKNMVPEYNTK